MMKLSFKIIKEKSPQFSQNPLDPQFNQPLRIILCAADMIPIDSISKFKNTIIKDAFLPETITNLSDISQIPEIVRKGFHESKIPQSEIITTLEQMCKRRRLNFSEVEGIVGKLEPPAAPIVNIDVQLLSPFDVP